MKIVTLKTSRRGERKEDIDENFEDIKKRGKRREMILMKILTLKTSRGGERREMRDIDEDSEIEDIKKRERRER